ncbi:hypothetical protein B0H11DRAFT_2221818 [Mycena galericulata]|nr:hypothetical protein B0H11DRAFT_2221818 [Mycena galericulata]
MVKELLSPHASAPLQAELLLRIDLITVLLWCFDPIASAFLEPSGSSCFVADMERVCRGPSYVSPLIVFSSDQGPGLDVEFVAGWNV